jgi:hypothetical protein
MVLLLLLLLVMLVLLRGTVAPPLRCVLPTPSVARALGLNVTLLPAGEAGFLESVRALAEEVVGVPTVVAGPPKQDP